MEVIANWNVLSFGAGFELFLDMSKEPGLVPFSDLVQLAWNAGFYHVSCHDDGLIFAKN